MCGILGVVRFDRSDTDPADRAAVFDALAGLARRGPDDRRVWAAAGAAIGATRLAMSDLSGGAQPMSSADGRQVCVFNGELYDTAAIKARLDPSYRFRTTSDTEVLLALLTQRGPGALAAVDGQYAAAVFDTATKTLILTRDRFGIHPLYYAQSPHRVVFGSAPQLVAALAGCHGFDTTAIYFALVAGGVPEPLTVRAGVRQVKAGHALRFDPHGHFEQTVDPLRFPPDGEETSRIELEELRAAFDLAVTRRCHADVPLGLLLSGGVDSAAVAASAARNGHHLPAFTLAAAGDAAAGEADAAAATAIRCGHTPRPVPVCGNELAARLVDVAADLGDPLWRSGPVGFDLLAERVAAENVKGLLTGDGADELFCGYDVFKHTLIRRGLGRRPGYAACYALLRGAAATTGAAGAQGPFCYQRGDLLYSHLPRWQPRAAVAHSLLAGDLRRGIAVDAYQQHLLDTHSEHLAPLSPLNRARYLEVHTRFIPFLVSMQSDRPFMRHGVEARHPFLSRPVADLALRADPRRLVTALHDKLPIRHGLVKPDLGPLAATPKAPFEPGWEALRDAPLFRDLCATHINRQAIDSAGLFDPQRVQRLATRALHPQPSRPGLFELLLQVLTTQMQMP